MTALIPVTFRTPFGLGPEWVRHVRPGMTLQQMAEAMDMPAEWWMPGRGAIDINGHIVPRDMWRHVRPKPDAGITEIRFLFALHGGGDEGGKNPLALIASLALLAATGFVAGGGLATTFGLSAKVYGAGTFGANLAAGLIGIAGQALIGGLAGKNLGGGVNSGGVVENPNAAGIEGNILQPEGPVPRVMGTRTLFPPFASEPLIYFDGDDEVAEAIYVLAGPHALSDVRLGGAPIADMRGVEIEMFEGWPGGARSALVQRQAKTEQIGQELRSQVLKEDGVTVDDLADGGWQPQPYVIATRDAPDEVWIDLQFPQGLSNAGSASDKIRVPFRLRMREIGDEAWINVPEVHFVGAEVRPIRASIKLVWKDAPDVQVAAPARPGWLGAFIEVPGQTEVPTGGAWAADASFDAGSGDGYLVVTNYQTTAVRNVQLSETEAVFVLDTASFPRGAWEIEITRGLAVLDDDFDVDAYTVGGDVWSLFGAQGVGSLRVAQNQKDRVSVMGIVRAANIWNEHPVPNDRFATVAIRARNRQVSQLSLTASGYVRDWDGASWASWVTTPNPAAHYRDVLVNRRFNADPVPVGVIDDDDLVAWRADCAAKGYEINAIVEGGTVREVQARVAASGFALPRVSNEWGVVRGRDTSADSPVQVFTPRNAREIAGAKVFPRLPDGIRASFRDSTKGYREAELIYPPAAVGGRLLAIDYPDHVTRAQVLRQVTYDYRELSARSATLSFVAGAEALACRRGDLIEVQHNMFSAETGAARVVDWSETAAGVASITLDTDVPVVNEPDWFDVGDFLAVPDVFAIGKTTAIALRGDDGTPVRTVTPVANASGEARVLSFAAPVAATGIRAGALAIIGPAERVSERLIVTDIQRRGRFDALVTCVDEAPALFADH